MDEDRRRRLFGEDSISGLPDELLHGILLRLRSARAAARTSVLSRRWRHVWAHLPELHLNDLDAASFLDSVDAALATYSAPTLGRLSIALFAGHGPHVPAGRVAPWLRFASQRVVGALCLFVPPRIGSPLTPRVRGQEPVLELPACDGAKTITLSLEEPWRLRLRPAGLFTALTSLTIRFGRMEGSELTALVCTRCPCLRGLTLFVTLVAVSDFSIRSDSLRSLWFCVRNTRRLDVVAPRLQVLSVSHAIEAHISAPKLAKVVWRDHAYDPRRHQFADVGRRLRLLEIGQASVVTSLTRQFDEVDKLKLEISIPQGIAGYESFLNGTNKLPKCKTLSMSLAWHHHGLAPGILHLLRSCNSTRKFSVLLLDGWRPSLRHSCPSSCPCRLPESCRIDDVALSSLEEVEIYNFTSSHEELEFVEQLSGCNAAIVKKLIINYTLFPAPPLTKEVHEKVCSMFLPNVKVEFYVFLDGRRVLFD